MSQPITEQFINALKEAEKSNDSSPLVALFADKSECKNLTSKEPERGTEGAKKFWDAYLESFESVQSEFFSVIDTSDHGVLEWTAKGKLPNGRSIDYRGVSVLKYAEDKVESFHTYYDSAAFVATPANAETCEPCEAARAEKSEKSSESKPAPKKAESNDAPARTGTPKPAANEERNLSDSESDSSGECKPCEAAAKAEKEADAKKPPVDEHQESDPDTGG